MHIGLSLNMPQSWRPCATAVMYRQELEERRIAQTDFAAGKAAISFLTKLLKQWQSATSIWDLLLLLEQVRHFTHLLCVLSTAIGYVAVWAIAAPIATWCSPTAWPDTGHLQHSHQCQPTN